MNLNITLYKLAVRFVALLAPKSVNDVSAEIEQKIEELEAIIDRNHKYADAHEELANHIRAISYKHRNEARVAGKLADRLSDILS